MSRRKGFVLITAGIAAVILFGALGLAVDLGRMYIVKSESQSSVDGAAIDAALELDGTTQGLADAVSTANAALGRYDLGQFKFSNISVQFATDLAGPWSDANAASNSSNFVRVAVTSTVNMYFLGVVSGSGTGRVAASAVGAQVAKTGFKEGLFPFSPFAHDNVGPHFGLVPGTDYTLRWASNPSLKGGAKNVCQGDQTQQMIDIAQAQGGSERGFIEDTSASVVRSTIIDDYQSVFRSIGDIVAMTGGAKQTELDALDTRILQDTDSTSSSFTQYKATGKGNGRRIIAVPINDGGSPPGIDNRIVNIGAFFLKPTGDYGSGGGQAWCAEYIGSWVQGSTKTGAGQAGAFVVRLVQ